MGGDKIAAKLREKQVPTPFGGIWTGERIREILSNEKYTGNALLQKRFVIDHLTKRKVKNEGQLEQFFVVGTHPAIIDTTTFEKANVVRKQRREHCGAKDVSDIHYPFSGLLVCGHCGKSYRRHMNNGRATWQCSTFLQMSRKACPSKYIREDILIAKTADVLGLLEFDETVFAEKISEIHVPSHNHLIFVFCDGFKVEITWQNPSRRDSWTDEMKQVARERQNKINEEKVKSHE